MTSLFEDSKQNCKDLFIVWFDLKNAFGSVPHSVLFDMMSRLSIPSSFISLCQDIYNGSSSRICTSSGLTDTIPLTIGVKQGCPLSPLLFNLVLQGMLIGLNGVEGGYEVSPSLAVKYLAYADDLCIVARSKDQVNAFISRIVEFMDWAGLSFNVQKCASLSCGSLSLINNKGRKHVEPYQPFIGHVPIPPLKWSDNYKYLGVRTEIISTKNVKQVAMHKRIFLRNNPNWLSDTQATGPDGLEITGRGCKEVLCKLLNICLLNNGFHLVGRRTIPS